MSKGVFTTSKNTTEFNVLSEGPFLGADIGEREPARRLREVSVKRHMHSVYSITSRTITLVNGAMFW